MKAEPSLSPTGLLRALVIAVLLGSAEVGGIKLTERRPVESEFVQLAGKAEWGFMRNIINIDTFFKDPKHAEMELQK